MSVESGNTAATTPLQCQSQLGNPAQQGHSSTSQQNQGTSIQFKPWGPRDFAGPAMQVIALRDIFRERVQVKPATTDPVLYIWFAFASCGGVDRVTLAGFCCHITLQSPKRSFLLLESAVCPGSGAWGRSLQACAGAGNGYGDT